MTAAQKDQQLARAMGAKFGPAETTAEYFGEDVAVTYDNKDTAELVKRYNAFPELLAAVDGLLKATRKAHEIASASNDDYADNEAHYVGEWMDEAHQAIANATK